MKYYYVFIYEVPLNGDPTKVLGKGAWLKHPNAVRPTVLDQATMLGLLKAYLKTVPAATGVKTDELGFILASTAGPDNQWHFAVPTLAAAA